MHRKAEEEGQSGSPNLLLRDPAHVAIRTSNGVKPCPTPGALSAIELDDLIGALARAAGNAISARFDGVELHAGNGYLIHRFVAPNVNSRTDAYGGSLRGRAKLLLEIVEALVGAVGAGGTGVRPTPRKYSYDIREEDADELYPYLLGEELPNALACVHVSTSDASFLPPIRLGWPRFLIANLRSRVASGKLTVPSLAPLGASHADMMSFGRAFIANPDLPARSANRRAHGMPQSSRVSRRALARTGTALSTVEASSGCGPPTSPRRTVKRSSPTTRSPA